MKNKRNAFPKDTTTHNQYVTQTGVSTLQITNPTLYDLSYRRLLCDNFFFLGSGRVTFSTNESYMKAVQAKFVSIIAPKILMHIEIYPFFGNFPFCNI